MVKYGGNVNKLIQESLGRKTTKKSIINLQQSNNEILIDETKDIQKTSNQARGKESTISSPPANQTNKWKNKNLEVQ
ncbi:14658_t:CDS:2 [Gigaspora margarita]|uniref:14658_t:CDS:1 n=1 Tax=Gigaspora margarita TaxID=4874 RepID=A0ABN7UMS3_GIGMA|nr:14658_t:CDS:2 [Gigaspora margarita]